MESYLGWQAWYAARKFSSDTTSPSDLPLIGLLHIVEYFDTGRMIIHTGQRSPDPIDRWYIFLSNRRDDTNGIVDDFEGPKADAEAKLPDAILIEGNWASDSNYNRITEEALSKNWDGSDRSKGVILRSNRV